MFPEIEMSRSHSLAGSTWIIRWSPRDFWCAVLIVTKNKRAELISELQGNPKAHVEQIRKLAGKGSGPSNAQAATSACSGEPSLQNSLELAMQTLKHMPAHATREVSFLDLGTSEKHELKSC